jgi:hypothetical protein
MVALEAAAARLVLVALVTLAVTLQAKEIMLDAEMTAAVIVGERVAVVALEP